MMAVGSPGPSIAALVSRVLAKGWRDALEASILYCTRVVFPVQDLQEVQGVQVLGTTI